MKMLLLFFFGLLSTCLGFERCDHRCDFDANDGSCTVTYISSDFPSSLDISQYPTGRCLGNGQCLGTPKECPDCNTVGLANNCRGGGAGTISTFPGINLYTQIAKV